MFWRKKKFVAAAGIRTPDRLSHSLVPIRTTLYLLHSSDFCAYMGYVVFLLLVFRTCCGPGSSVDVATDYGLDGSGSNPGWDEIFRPSRPALGPTQPPVQWVPGLSRG